MYQINEDHPKFLDPCPFSTTAKKVATFTDAYQGERVTRTGIGDVTKSLCLMVIQAPHKAVDEMGRVETFYDYESENGYVLLRGKVVESDYKARGMEVRLGEIFIPDDTESGSGDIQEISNLDPTVAVCSPVYSVYLDTDVMVDRSGDYDAMRGIYASITYLPYVAESDFTPAFPASRAPDLIYLCSSDNPTGAVMRKEALQHWVDYTSESGGVTLSNAACEVYITEADILCTVYECEGTRTCATELCSFSRKVDSTGFRLSMTVTLHNLRKKVKYADGTAEETELHALWGRCHEIKFNSAPYTVQRAGEVIYSAEGQRETAEQVVYYTWDAHYIYEALKKTGFSVYDGIDTPYVWVKTPGDMTSWEFFDTLLEEAAVVGTPDSGFGPYSEHHLYFSALGIYGDTTEAMACTQALQL